MKNYPCPFPKSLYSASILATFLLVGATVSRAAIAPYVSDASTLHLWHFDETALPCIDYGTPATATNLTYTANGTTLDNASFSGFTNCVSFGTTAASGDVMFNAGSGNVGTPLSFTYAGTSGAFTFEAMVYVAFNPTASGTEPFQIMDCDGEGSSTRVFQFRLDPIGFSANTNPANVGIEFINGTGQVAVPPIPSGSIAQDNWYHVAVTYNGSPNTTSNLLFYWTPVSSSATNAVCIYGATMTGNLPDTDVATTVFSVGNSARNPSGGTGADVANFVGMIDELRISSVARASNQMIFFASGVTVSSPSPASALIPQNGSASFTVTASPSRDYTNVTYQWYQGTPGSGSPVVSPDAAGSTFTGITSPTLTITNAKAGDNGATFYCVVSQTGTANTATSTAATLTVHTPQPLQWSDASANGLWDLVSGNWLNTSTSSTVDFYPGDNATFNDSGPGGTVTLNSSVVATSVTFSDNAKSYTVSGTGSIAGAASLTNNSGSNTIKTTNAFTGSVTINAGTLTIGGAGDLGLGNYAGNIANSGSLVYSSSTPQTLSGVISQTGALTVNGSGLLTLSGSNTYSGGTTIGLGSTLELSALGSFGTGNITNNGTLWFSGTQTVANDISGSGILTNDATGTLTLTGDNSYTGATVISGPDFGGLVVASSTALGNTPSVTLYTTTGGAEGGTRITLSNGVVTPSSIPLYLPCSSTTTRSLLYSVSNNNTWSGPIYLNGDETAGDTIAFGSGTAPGILTIQGNVTGNSFDNGNLQLRGNDAGTSTGQSYGGGNGVINGIINLGGGGLVFNDGVTWTINSTGHTFGLVQIANGATMQLGANNVIPSTSPVTILSATIASSLDLNGFTQLLGGALTSTGAGGAEAVVTNSSTTSPGTLILSGQDGAFGGSLVDGETNTQPLNFILTGGSALILSASCPYFGSTLITDGSDLLLTTAGAIPNTTNIDVQSGSTFDLSSLSSGYTINAGQTLMGSGSINNGSLLTINGTLSPGEKTAIGALSINNSLTLQGSANFRINKTGSVLTSDQVTGYSAVTLGGTLTVTSTGSTALANGDTFTLFNGAAPTGSFSNIYLPPLPLHSGLVWNISQLATSGTISVVAGSDLLTFSVSGGAVNFAWSPNQLGWTLQSNSINIAVQADWFPVAGSTSVTNISVPINKTQPYVYFRLAP